MASAPVWIRQAAAVPIRDGQVCLVTSSSGKRWVIPKGIIDPGTTAMEIALQEAWEEAGVVGQLAGPFGSYCYTKYGGTCHVLVYVLEVTQAAEDWPERGVRQRAWLSPEEAAARLDDAGLPQLILACAARRS